MTFESSGNGGYPIPQVPTHKIGIFCIIVYGLNHLCYLTFSIYLLFIITHLLYPSFKTMNVFLKMMFDFVRLGYTNPGGIWSQVLVGTSLPSLPRKAWSLKLTCKLSGQCKAEVFFLLSWGRFIPRCWQPSCNWFWGAKITRMPSFVVQVPAPSSWTTMNHWFLGFLEVGIDHYIDLDVDVR